MNLYFIKEEDLDQQNLNKMNWDNIIGFLIIILIILVSWAKITKQTVEIGRASCRERVQISVVAVSLKKKKKEIEEKSKKENKKQYSRQLCVRIYHTYHDDYY